MHPTRFLSAIAVSLLLVAGCNQPEPADDQPQEPPTIDHQAQAQQQEMEQQDEGMTLLDPSEHSQQLMDQIRDYDQWSYHGDLDTHYESGHPGDVWVIAYANETGEQAVDDQNIPVPEGAIYVKEEYDADGAEDPFAVTVMEKLSEQQGDWYWMKTDPDMERIVEGPEQTPLEGTENLGCIDCHGAAADDDYLMTPGLGLD